MIKRLKLLFINPKLVDFVSDINSRYDTTNEWCKKKEWKVYDNVKKTLEVMEDKKKNEVDGDTDNKWFYDRAVDVSLKTFISSGK